MLRATLFLFVTLPTAIFGESASACSLELSNPGRKDIFYDVFKWKTPTRTTKPIKGGEAIVFTCGNGFLKNDFPSKELAFQCDGGKYNKTYAYEDLLCRSDFHQRDLIAPVNANDLGSKLLKCDDKNWVVYQVKTVTTDGKVKHLYTVCFDKNTMRPKFSFQHKRTEKPTKEFVFRGNDVWGFAGFGENAEERLSLSQGYVQKVQQRRMTRAFPEKYSQNRPYPYYFNRGHLAPYSQFADPEEQKATSQYINAAPQWKELNEGTWSLIEKDAKKLLIDSPNQWEIYTGTLGTIPTTRGPLYAAPTFFPDGRFKKGLLPVPLLFWKIVHNPEDQTKSRVFVGINNPEFKSPAEVKDAYKICRPVADGKGASYQGNEFQGFTYECKLSEFLTKLSALEKVVK